MAKAAIVLPFRQGSTRYPGKPLALLRGATGEAKTLVARTVEAARNVEIAADIFVTCDSEEIAAAGRAVGAEVILTDPECRNGTERVAQAVERAGIDADVIVNLQGDAPLTPPWFVSALVETMRAEPEEVVATPVLRCDLEALRNFLNDRRNGRVGGTTVVRDLTGHALYFSKEVIPFIGREPTQDDLPEVWHHVGVYAYRPDALKDYARMAPSPLEAVEGLEQLRFLEHGLKVRAVEVEARGHSFWELNNPEDVPLIEGYLKRMGIA
ncbi:3-deoxy-manno-octulosonate cytidylyltransferase [Lutibaculum baratangense]|uniref:3-deoxy-manno-octulosonate cytidylyltransferase n=1 Tax=Lutibaculum baratangense AMV1 TaxID=631454 RepID=V4RFN1_9HYPH|nr:manno-octulosonate cytidylyltransferase [Lutibaculum baratangense]ESR24194.1 3-deoxy-manno-octulosonate cytidylyltransferase [Lutibaculum baratangense AMV1]